MKKKMNNKGFSLVELIVVIAIMAVLIAVLAPQYLRYVERSRLQSDNTAIGEIVNAAKIALTSDTVLQDLTWTGNTVELAFDGAANANKSLPIGTRAANNSQKELYEELQMTIGAEFETTSNAYNAGAAPVIVITRNTTTGTTTLSVRNYISEVGATATTEPF